MHDNPHTADIVERLLRTMFNRNDSGDVFINPDGPEAAAEIKALREALVKCRDKFLHYEMLHRLKCSSEGDEKADRNRDMADMIDAALKDHRKVQP